MKRPVALGALPFLLVTGAARDLRAQTGGPALTALAVTAYSTCVVANGTVWCWGDNGFGEFGLGFKEGGAHPAPQMARGLEGVTGLWAGSASLAALSGGRLWTWGDYHPGGGLLPAAVSFPVPGAIGPVVSGEMHTCAEVAGRTYCWGMNDRGQLGNGDLVTSAAPVPVEPAQRADALAATWDSTCALAGGKVLCWGSNLYGKLARPQEVEYAPAPHETASTLLESGVTQIVAACDGYCALKEGTVLCWGRNDSCLLGNPTENQTQTVPMEVPGMPADVVRLVPGNGPCPSHLCALTAGGELWCWGLNRVGQLGREPAAPPWRLCSPVRIGGPLEGRKVRLAATGREHTCAVADEDMWCWGANQHGQLGYDSLGIPTHIPRAVRTPWLKQ